MDELGENELETKKNLIPGLEQYAITGGPGRPKGLLNKFTQIKKDMLDAWKEADGKEKFLKLLKGPTSDYIKALDKIVAIMPKEQLIDIQDNQGPKVVIVRTIEVNKSKPIDVEATDSK